MEKGVEQEKLELFAESFKQGLDGLFELVEMTGEALPVDPFSMGVDERTIEELTEAEKQTMQKALYQRLGLEPKTLDRQRVREYATGTPDGTGQIKVSVYTTNQPGIFLQELTFPDSEKRWVVGPNQDI